MTRRRAWLCALLVVAMHVVMADSRLLQGPGNDGLENKNSAANQKNKEKDIVMAPSEGRESQAEADQYAALLMLYHLTPSLPLHRKLPDPYAQAQPFSPHSAPKLV